MPQRKCAIHDLRKSRQRRLHNLDIKTDLRKTIRSFTQAIEENKLDEAKTALNVVFKKIDKATKRNLLHANTASRRKSRFSKLLTSAKA